MGKRLVRIQRDQHLAAKRVNRIPLKSGPQRVQNAGFVEVVTPRKIIGIRNLVLQKTPHGRDENGVIWAINDQHGKRDLLVGAPRDADNDPARPLLL